MAAAPPPASDLASSASRCGRTTVTVQTASAATLAETLPSKLQHRILAGANDEVIDMVDPCEFENGGRGIDRLQHMHREPAVVELQW